MKISAATKPRILLLSGYDAASHSYWRKRLVEGLMNFSWTEIALPDRYFSWRVRGNSLTFAFQYREFLIRQYDCLIVTSMVDLASLRGFVPQLTEIPNIVYFHENQFAYPTNESTDKNSANIVSAQLTSIYSLLCADKILFNSNYNQQTFFDGAQQLLKKLPDGIPKQLLAGMSKKSQVLPVPISNDILPIDKNRADKNEPEGSRPLQIVWNHRWEYDKQPEIFFEVMDLLKQQGLSFQLHVVGQSFRQVPSCFKKARQSLNEEILSWGFQSKEVYQRILVDSDIVISTALHDFQGLSMLQAMASGCVAVAPHRVAYPEYIPEENLYQLGDPIDEVGTLYKKLRDIFAALKNPDWREQILLSQNQSIKHYRESHLLIKYEQLFNASIEEFKSDQD